MRLIDSDRLLRPDMIRMCYHLPNGDIAMPIGDIKHAPTVDAAPVVHGRWIPVLNGIDDDTNPAFDCSECDAMCRKKHNYCPGCGAKMDLEEHDAKEET